MSELKQVVLKTETLEATDAQKYHMLLKQIELLNQGKSAQDAHSFVLTLLKDGYYAKYAGSYGDSALISFGNYLLSDGRMEKFEAHPENARVVHDVDLSFWKNPIVETTDEKEAEQPALVDKEGKPLSPVDEQPALVDNDQQMKGAVVAEGELVKETGEASQKVSEATGGTQSLHSENLQEGDKVGEVLKSDSPKEFDSERISEQPSVDKEVVQGGIESGEDKKQEEQP